MRDRESLRIPLAVMLFLTVFGSTLVFSPASVIAQVGCGATITANTTLKADIGPCSGEGLIFAASGITLNCAGYSISGKGVDAGVNLAGHTKVTVENCNVTGFLEGFYLPNSNSSTLSRNTASSDGNDGFYLTSSSSMNFLVGNLADKNLYGFSLYSSSYNSLIGNTAYSNSYSGIYLSSSSGNSLTENNASDNGHYGLELGMASNSNILTGNTANSNTGTGFIINGSTKNSIMSLNGRNWFVRSVSLS